MNSINFFSGDKFPMYREALAKMQEMTNLIARLAGIGGNTYILSGCEGNGNGSVSDGFVVVNGELLPFIGSAVPSSGKVTIQETRSDVNTFGVVYPETYITRVAKFALTGEYNWSDFEPIQNNKALYTLIKDIKGDAPGTIKMWAGLVSKIPSDYRICDGSELNPNEFPELYDSIGVSFGGDGNNTFNLPDLRGRFIVGFNSADSDYNAIGKIDGSKEIVLTEDNLPAHNHTASADTYFNKLAARAADIDATNTTKATDSGAPDTEYRIAGMTSTQWNQATIKSVGGNQAHENRPPYFTLAYIIKVR
jgi:microcystin-dependent protein